MPKTFRELFPQNSIIGMIHLAGDNSEEKLHRALDELHIYEEEGLNGAIIEDYHGSAKDVERVLRESVKFDIPRGVNFLREPLRGFETAYLSGAHFVQIDNIHKRDMDAHYPGYELNCREWPDILVLGGVRFKYQHPTGRSLQEDVHEGIHRCEAIVTTGDGTGVETPLDKLRDFRRIMDTYPLIVGAGVTAENVRQQLAICDGAIVGSYFKEGDTQAPVVRGRVRELMKIVNQI